MSSELHITKVIVGSGRSRMIREIAVQAGLGVVELVCANIGLDGFEDVILSFATAFCNAATPSLPHRS
jgi:hypothetical protein